MREVSYPVFVDDKGNRILFPTLYSDEEKSYDWDKAMMIRLVLGLTVEQELFKVPVDEENNFVLTHVKTEAIHRGFAHGGSVVYLIGGPEFDKVVKESENADIN